MADSKFFGTPLEVDENHGYSDKGQTSPNEVIWWSLTRASLNESAPVLRARPATHNKAGTLLRGAAAQTQRPRGSVRMHYGIERGLCGFVIVQNKFVIALTCG